MGISQKIILYTFTLFIIPNGLWGQSESKQEFHLSDIFRFNGYLKDLHTHSFFSLDSSVSDNLLHNRLNLKTFVSPSINLNVEMRNRIFYGEKVNGTPYYSDYINTKEWVDLSFFSLKEKAIIVNSQLDRACLRYMKNRWDIIAGKQRVNWGLNMVWNPNDLFNTSNFIDFDYEERPGSLALRVKYATGDLSGFDIAWKPEDKQEEHVAALLYHFNIIEYDFQILSGIDHNDLVAGGGWSGQIRNAGFKGELTSFFPVDSTRKNEKIQLNATLSLDYAFKNTTYLHGSVLYNHTGIDSIVPLIGVAFEPVSLQLTARNLMPGKLSVFGQISKTIGSLSRVEFSCIYGPKVNFLFLMPSFSYSIHENWDVGLFGQLFYLDYAGQGFFDMKQFIFRLKWSF